MSKIRAAVLFASADKYVTTLLSIATTAVVARLIGPAEFGISVLGTAVLGMANAVREIGTSAYIVQNRELTLDKLRAVFTLNLGLTLVIVAAVLLGAPALATALGAPGLDVYLRVSAVAFLTGVVVFPLHALLAREMAFGRIASVHVVSTGISSAVLIAAAWAGASFLSFAYAQAVSAIAGMLLLLRFRPDFGLFRPNFQQMRDVLSFSMFGGGTALLFKAGEFLSLIVLGMLMPPAAIGLLHRASLLANFPERTIMAGVNAAALPAFSVAARAGEDLSRRYLGFVERISAVIWPCLGLLVLLAHPLVLAFLGEDWRATVPLVQIIGGALLLNFPPGINFPVLIAAGAVRMAFWLAAVQLAVALPIIAGAARLGIEAVAWATWPIVGFNVAISMLFVRRVVPFRWASLGAALGRSLAASVAALVGPMVIAFVAGGPERIGLGGAAVALLLAGTGWLVALRGLDHPVWSELQRAAEGALRRLSARSRASE
jgi:O-antigen/teichoic acid export membrane protein